MNAERVLWRLRDIRWSIREINALLAGKTFETMYSDAVTKAAFERFLEILSEASRHIPDEMKHRATTDIPWRRVADLGNHIRHAYHKVDAAALWSIYEDELGRLDAAAEAMIAEIEARPTGDAS